MPLSFKLFSVLLPSHSGHYKVLPHIFFIRNSLHWPPIHKRMQFKMYSLFRNCLTGSGPQYFKSYCISVSSIPSRPTLRSSARGHLVVPQTRMSMTQSRSFAIVGPFNWNKLPQSLQILFPITSD